MAIDDLKRIHHRTSLSSIHHTHELTPHDPKPDEPVMINISTSLSWSVDHVVCFYTLDGSEPIGSRGNARNGSVPRLERTYAQWDSSLWGYVISWQGTLPAQVDGTIVHYRIGTWNGDGPGVFADWPDIKATTYRVASSYFHEKPQKPGVGCTYPGRRI